MKRHITLTLIASCALLLGSSVAQADDAMPWQVSLTGNYGSWKNDTLPQDGTQSQVQGQVSYETEQWGATVTGRTVSTDYKTELAEERFSVSSFTDPVLSTYYATKTGPFSLRGGVDVSAGMGKKAYTTAERSRIIFDPVATDLMIVNSYGAGTDIAPHFVAVWEINEGTSLGLSARYTITGDYDPTDDGVGNTYAPGDSLLVMLNGGVTVADGHMITFQVLGVTKGGDTQDGTEVFKAGDQLLGEVRYIGSLTTDLSLIASAMVSTQGKNKVGAGGGLADENANSNNNAWEIYGMMVWWLDTDLGLTGMVGYKNVSANGLGVDEAYYDGGRTRSFIEPGFLWGIGDSTSLMGKFRYSRIEDKKDYFASSDSAYDVYNVDLSIVQRF